MSVCIRLSRLGRLHRPFFRIVAIDRRCHREGVANEILGTYDPLKPDQNVEVKLDRVEAWVKEGAQVSQAVASLLKANGYVAPATAAAKKAKKRKVPKGDGKTWVKPSRRALRKHAAKLKAVRKAELAAKAAEKAAAAPAADAPAAE